MHAVFHRLWLAGTLAAAGLVACSRQEPAPEPVRAVRTILLGAETAAGSLEFAAEIRARVESRLGFRVAGKLISRSAEVGQQVKAGQVLAQIDGTDLKLSQDAALAAVRTAQTNHDIAAAEFKRYKDLRAQGFISALDLERREATLKAQKAQLEQAQAQASVQGNQSGYAALTAPAAGVVTGVDAEVGTVLAAGTPVFRLAQDGPRDAVFAVPEDAVAGMRALLGKPGGVMVRAWGGSATAPATVREVAAAADPATRTFQIKADLAGTPLQLGQTVTVLLPLPPRDGVIKLPLAAVTQQQGQTAVWLVTGEGAAMTVKLQPISVGGADGNSVVITAGLHPGQRLVTAGVHALSQGQKVKLYEAPVPATTPASTATR